MGLDARRSTMCCAASYIECSWHNYETNPMKRTNIESVSDEHTADGIVLDHMARYAHGKETIEILEAGCGRRWPFDLRHIDYHLTGVDINEYALRLRQEKKRDLHEVVLGDLRTVDFGNRRFDIIYSAFVLEHVPNAELVLENFLTWLKPGGLMILKFPDRDSVYGFVTRFTPLWFHILYKRYICGYPNAGKPGFGPFPTVHEKIVARQNFERFIRARNLSIEVARGFGTLPTFQRLGTRVMAKLSLGRLTAEYYNLLYILRTEPIAVDADEADAGEIIMRSPLPDAELGLAVQPPG